jgi:hypothetical protein
VCDAFEENGLVKAVKTRNRVSKEEGKLPL